MIRQAIINGICGGVVGYASSQLIDSGQPILAALLFIAWFIGMMNSLFRP